MPTNGVSIFVDESGSDHPPWAIAGVVVGGGAAEIQKLPAVSPHLFHPPKPKIARSALRALYDHAAALPFAFLVDQDCPRGTDKYFQMVNTALFLLLGWILPRPSHYTPLRIFFERQGGMRAGDTRTEYFRGVLEGWKARRAERFKLWWVQDVRWTDKTTGLIPYADLLAYLAYDHASRKLDLGAAGDLTGLPGYARISPALMEQLSRIDEIESSRAVADVLDLEADLRGTHLLESVRAHVRERVPNTPGLRRELLEELERRYQAKARDLGALKEMTRGLFDVLGTPEAEEPIRVGTMRALIQIQLANHTGNPEAALDAAATYELLRRDLAEDDRELVAYAELNLAVHYCDQFEFSMARHRLERVLFDDAFPYLSRRARGRALSAFGQLLSIEGEWEEAEGQFVEALTLFESTTDDSATREGELTQTRIYRAINAIDGNLADSRRRVEEALGVALTGIPAFVGDIDPATEYRHHLFVRWLLVEPDSSLARGYLERSADWQMGTQHPWELIAFHRARLLLHHATGPDGSSQRSQAIEWFRKAIGCCAGHSEGSTLHFIGCVIAAVGACHFDELREQARALEAGLDGRLPAVAGHREVIRKALESPSEARVDELLDLLPFNYL